MMRKWLKELTLRKKLHIIWALYAIGCVLVLSFPLFFDIGDIALVLMISSWAFLIWALVLTFRWWRCPHCGCFLGRGQKDGDYCRECGKRVFWEDHGDF